jgi:hypothetical protein
MKKLLVTVALALTMALGSAAPAQAVPEYGRLYTDAHGWIVWANNDRYFPIRTRCHWTAGGYRWTTNWRIAPHGFKWTTSDAGSWGNRIPRNLSCSFVRAY